jgi:hypothetical protein
MSGNKTIHAVCALAFAWVLIAIAPASAGQAERKVFFGNLKNGAQIETPFKVEMKAVGLVVEPATKGVTDGHGHFHIIINRPLPDTGMPIPKDSLHIHYGNGQTEAELDLDPGDHYLILQFAKGDHIPYHPQIAEHIRITVTKRHARKVK